MKLIDLTRINQLINGLLDKINKEYATKAELNSGLKGKAEANHGTHLTLGTTSSTAFRGDYGNTAYKHSQAAHAPSNAQKNSDITKAEIEAKLTGVITTHKHTLLESNDTRSKNDLPSTYTNRGIVPEFKSSATIGLPEVGKGFTGLITYQQWSDTSAWSGGKATQFGTIDDGRMYYRKGDGSGWGTWYQFYTTQNKPTPADIGAAVANHGTHVSYGGNGSAATVSRSDHTHSYLPLSGGTMTGNVSYQFTGTGGHAIGSIWKNNDTNKTTFGGIGALANAGTGSSLYIGWGSEPWVASNNLQVSSSGIKYKNNKIYHAGDKPTPADIGAAKASHGNHVPTTQAAQNNVFLRNDNTWQKITPENIGAAAASHGTHVTYGGNGSAATVSRSDHTHSYLPLSGGTMTGNINFTDVTSTTYPAKSAMLTWNGSTDGADIYYQVDASDKGRLVLNTRDDADCIIAFANKSTIVSTIDNSGNFSGKAATATKATQDSAGQQINTTYIKGLSVSGRTITYTKGDGTTGTITTQDNNTTYTADTGIKLNGTKFQHTNAITAGTAQGDANKTLSWGGTFTIPTVTYDAQGHITGKGTTTMTMPGNPNTDTHHQAKNIVGASATATANATATNGNVYLNLIENGAVRSKHKIAGTGATTVTSDSSGNITINSTNTTYGVATTSANGLMSSSDKSKLDGIAAGANAYTHPAYTAKSSGLYKVTVDDKGHVSGTSAVTKNDITALGIPGSDTNTWRGVQDNLTSTAKDQSLSANQGKVLKGLIDGKLDASHANTTHLTIGTGAGNAAAGNHTHNYAGSSSAGGAATSANKVNNNLVVKLNSGTTEGTNQFTFNGSAGKTINITPSTIGLSGLSSSSSVLCYEGSGYDAGGSRVSLGCDNTVTGAISIGLGENNKVTGTNSLVLGKKNSCTTHNTFMIGIENEVSYSYGTEWAYSFLLGERNKLGFKEGESAGSLSTDAEVAYGSVALGQYNQVGYKCAVMGESNRAKNFGYAIGANNSACNYSLAIGSYCNALDDNTTAVGSGAYAGGGSYASCFGYYSRAEASYALAMGNSAYARATRAVAVGGKAEEEEALAVGTYSNAFGKCSAALTPHTYAIGENSVCVGYAAETNAKNAMAIGYQTKVGNTGEGVTAMGHFNKTDVIGCSAGTTGTALVIGNGASDNARSNACRITFAGAVIGKAAYQSSGADYAEYFEWLDGNTDSEDRRGYFVTMDGNKIKKAKEGDYILGVVSAYPAVIGNNDMEWSGKFLLDEFGDPIKKVQKTIIKEHELIKDVHFTDEEMQTLTDEERKQREMKIVEKEVECEYFVLNPDFDPDREYVHRADRPEWDTIGMLGVLTVYDDGTCQVNGFCKCNNDGIATACERGFDTYRVIGRVNENLIKIVFK